MRRPSQRSNRMQELLVDGGRCLRRPRIVGDGVELDDRPAAELHVVKRREASLDVHLAASELHESVPAGPTRATGPVLYVLDVKEQQSIGVGPDRVHRIAAALL